MARTTRPNSSRNQIVQVLMLSLAVFVLTACGAPPPTPTPTPDPDLALTGVSPAVALPGQQVTLEGTGFADDQVVSFAGVDVAIVSRTATTVVVTVPDGYGYPVIAIDEVSAERLLFVGSEYVGPTTLEGVQSALDDLDEDAALRLGALTYTGSDLVVDNRKLFGAGDATVLDATGDVLVTGRSERVAMLAELRVEATELTLQRGRLSTAAAGATEPGGAIVLADVDVEVDAFLTLAGDHLAITLRGVTAAATSIVHSGQRASLTISGGAMQANAIQVGPAARVTIDDAALTTLAGSLVVVANDTIEVRGSAFTSADSLTVQGTRGVGVAASTLTSVSGTVFFSDEGAVTVSGVDVAAASVVASGALDVSLEDVDIGATSGGVVVVSSRSDVTVAAATTTPVGGLTIVANEGAIEVSDAAITTVTGSVVLQADGPVLVVDTALISADAIIVVSSGVGEVVIEVSTLAASGSVIVQGAGNVYAGASGTVRLTRNASIVAGSTLAIVAGGSDAMVSDNGPLEGASVIIQSVEAHVTLRDNERIESSGDVNVQAIGAGGRLVAQGNVFVAADGAGTVVLETIADELSQSGNTFTGTASFPNN